MSRLGDTLSRVFATPAPLVEVPYEPPALSRESLAPAVGRALTAAPGKPADTPQVTPTGGWAPLANRAPLPTEWAPRAWAFYKKSGEARQSVDWIANGISRFHLYIGRRDTDGSGDPEPVEDPGQAQDVLDELIATMGERGLLHRLATHLLVPGESWLVGYPAPPGDPALHEGDTAWVVLSRAEWQDSDSGRLRVKLPGDPRATLDHWVTFPPDEVAVVPVWRPDAQDASYATSAFEAALAVFDELDGLDRRVGADINSRLAGAGVFAVPESATMPNPMQADGVNPLHSDPFITGLIKSMSTAIQNPDSASALTPIVIKVADESLAKMQHIAFSTPFDAQLQPLREGARERVAADMDVPAEVVTGLKDLNHWSAWSISDSAVKAHMGPIASLICTTLTRSILWPALGKDADTNLVVWYDPSEIVLRTDRSTETLKAHQQGLISGDAARRELGFGPDDAPAAPDTAPPDGGDGDSGQGGAGPNDQDEAGGQATPADRPNPPQQGARQPPEPSR